MGVKISYSLLVLVSKISITIKQGCKGGELVPHSMMLGVERLGFDFPL
jgi:hypothetical protein